MTDQDELAPSVLERFGEMAPGIAAVFGKPAAGIVVKALMQGAADALRRGVTADHIVHTLRHLSPLETPWGEDKRVGRDPT